MNIQREKIYLKGNDIKNNKKKEINFLYNSSNGLLNLFEC